MASLFHARSDLKNQFPLLASSRQKRCHRWPDRLHPPRPPRVMRDEVRLRTAISAAVAVLFLWWFVQGVSITLRSARFVRRASLIWLPRSFCHWRASPIGLDAGVPSSPLQMGSRAVTRSRGLHRMDGLGDHAGRLKSSRARKAEPSRRPSRE